MVIIYTIAVFIFCILLVGVVINNHLIFKQNKYLQAKGTIDIYLKKRFDLIPNLVTVAGKYLEHEKSLLSKIASLRADTNSGVVEKYESSEKAVNLWSSLQINNERYPELKSNEQFLSLQNSLQDMEDQVSAARRSYNATVNSYNNSIGMFPFNIVAKIKKFTKKDVLELL